MNKKNTMIINKEEKRWQQQKGKRNEQSPSRLAYQISDLFVTLG